MQKKDQIIEKTFALAIQNHKKNKFTLAIDLYKKILNINPNNLKAIFLLGTLFAQIKKFKEAEEFLSKLIKINPRIADAHNNLGLVFKELGELDKAETSIKKAIELNPKHADAHNNLGLLFKELGEIDKSKISHEKAIELNPKHADAYNNLASLYKKFGEFKKSEIFYEKAIEINPRYVEAHNNLMELYEKTNQDDKLNSAIANAEKLIKNNANVKLFKGKLLHKKEFFLEAIENLNSFSFDSKKITLERSRVSTLAKCYDRINNTDKAFNYFQKTNNINLQLKNNEIDKDKYLKKIKIRAKFFNNPAIEKWPLVKLKNNRAEPIFLIGFPRSGTTLLDTILRSHPLIEVIEEKPILAGLINSLNQLPDGPLEGLRKIEDHKLEEIRKNYYDSLESYINNHDSSKLYIDKMPLNIIHVAEILRIFPNAKFIISIRHPCDCVLSCFMQDFHLNNAMSNFLKLDDSAKLYDSVMNLWFEYKSKFSFNYHEVRYENLISNFETKVKSALDFLELSWDNSLHNFHKTAKKRERIFTSSYDQVIKPIYSQASGRWVRYKEHISEIYPILEPWIKKLN